MEVFIVSNRRYPSHPIPAVSVVVVGSKGVLLARRDKAPGRGLWSVPGGGVELGETQREAAVREVNEETGVKCIVLNLINTFDYISRDDSDAVEFHFLLNQYLAKAVTEKTRAETLDGEVKWFHPDKLPPDIANPRIAELIGSQREAILKLMAESHTSDAIS
jgi:8-oxo-dGTP diphosphatase